MRKTILFLESLIDEGLDLEALSKTQDAALQEAEAFDRRYSRWRKNVVQALTYASLDDHLHEIQEVFKEDWWIGLKITHLTGLLQSAHDLVSNGFIGNIKSLLHAEMFESMVDQAKALNETGHIIPAAVLGRIIIESWLKDQAINSGIAVADGAKATIINDSLKGAAVYSTPKWRQIQALLDIGNSAAHGKASEFTPQDVEKMLAFVEANCI